MAVDYEDERFKQVEAEKENALSKVNDTYNSMINSSDEYYQAQIDATNDYAKTQQELQQQQSDLAIEQIEQEKQEAEDDYVKEQKAAYVDYQKSSNQYGLNAEVLADQGLANSGLAESTKLSMYNEYQNRVATARDSYNKVIADYDIAIKDAQLQNNSALAEIAYNALQSGLELALEGFQYKNTLLTSQLEALQSTEDTYYSRWQDVLSQINTENALAEQIREYNIEQSNWEKEYELSKSSTEASNAYYNSITKTDDESSDSLVGSTSANGRKIIANPYTGEVNEDCKYGVFKYGDTDTGYQPNNIDGVFLTKFVTVAQMLGTGNTDSKGNNIDNQNVWTANGKYYVWDGFLNKYIDITEIQNVEDSAVNELPKSSTYSGQDSGKVESTWNNSYKNITSQTTKGSYYNPKSQLK